MLVVIREDSIITCKDSQNLRVIREPHVTLWTVMMEVSCLETATSCHELAVVKLTQLIHVHVVVWHVTRCQCPRAVDLQKHVPPSSFSFFILLHLSLFLYEKKTDQPTIKGYHGGDMADRD